ncbi:hypothetical protein D3C85_1628530 [compost metagenome]
MQLITADQFNITIGLSDAFLDFQKQLEPLFAIFHPVRARHVLGCCICVVVDCPSCEGHFPCTAFVVAVLSFVLRK